MEMSPDRKSGITSDLLKELIAVMKGSAGKKFAPAVTEVSVEPEDKPDDALKAHLEGLADKGEHGDDDDIDLEGLMSDEDHDGEDDEPLTGASARMAKLAAMRKLGC